MLPPRKKLPPIKEEDDKEDDIGLSQYPPNDPIEKEEFYHPIAVQQTPIDDKEDDIGLSQSPPNDPIEEEEFYHPVAVQQTPIGEKVHSGPALRVDTNVKRGSPISGSSKSKGLEDMVYEEYCIPFKYKLYATGSLWLLLFGFVLFSGTFTNFKLNAAEVLFSRLENVPMLVLGTLFCGASSCALIYLSWRWKRNSIWLVERILL